MQYPLCPCSKIAALHMAQDLSDLSNALCKRRVEVAWKGSCQASLKVMS